MIKNRVLVFFPFSHGCSLSASCRDHSLFEQLSQRLKRNQAALTRLKRRLTSFFPEKYGERRRKKTVIGGKIKIYLQSECGSCLSRNNRTSFAIVRTRMERSLEQRGCPLRIAIACILEMSFLRPSVVVIVNLVLFGTPMRVSTNAWRTAKQGRGGGSGY